MRLNFNRIFCARISLLFLLFSKECQISILGESLATLSPPDRLVSLLSPLRVYIFLIDLHFSYFVAKYKFVLIFPEEKRINFKADKGFRFQKGLMFGVIEKKSEI